MANQPVLDIAGLRVRFGDTVALAGLDLAVAAGEVVCLLGANGAGKTTTLNAILGLVSPTAGTVHVAGHDPIAARAAAMAALAYVPEQVALYPTLTGLENLAYLAELERGAPAAPADLATALDAIGLEPAARDRRAATYSKGMRQKIGLAAALLKQARLLILDEPLSGLDPDAADQFGQLVRQAAAGGTGVLMATHDIFRARDIADRIGIMKAGNLVAMIAADDIDGRALESVYLGHMRGNA